jgi:hypothetical protein
MILQFGRARLIEIFCLLTIVVLAFSLRIFQIEDRMFWYGDMGRDVLIANKIITDNIHPLIGHTASGFEPVFYYPPYYYYLLSILLRITSDPIILTGIVSFFQSVFIILLYYLCKATAGKLVGLLTSFFYAVSSATIQTGSSIWPVYIMPMFFYLGLKLTNEHTNKNSYMYKLLGHVVLIFSTTIHYSSMPFVLLLETRDFFFFIKKGNYTYACVLILFLCLIFTLLYYPLVMSLGLPENLYASFPYAMSANSEIITKFFHHMLASWKSLFSSKVMLIIGSCVVGIGVSTLFFTKTYARLKSATPALSALVVFCFFASLKPGELIPFWNYVILFPLFIFVAACVFIDLVQHTHTAVRLIGIFCGVLFTLALMNNFSSYRFPLRDFSLGRSVSEKIYQDAVTRGYFPNIYVAADEEYSKNLFDRYRLWYFFEKKKKGFVTYDSLSYELVQSLTGEWPYYLACENASRYDSACVKFFLKNFSSYAEVAHTKVTAHDVIIHLFLPKSTLSIQ